MTIAAGKLQSPWRFRFWFWYHLGHGETLSLDFSAEYLQCSGNFDDWMENFERFKVFQVLVVWKRATSKQHQFSDVAQRIARIRGHSNFNKHSKHDKHQHDEHKHDEHKRLDWLHNLTCICELLAEFNTHCGLAGETQHRLDHGRWFGMGRSGFVSCKVQTWTFTYPALGSVWPRRPCFPPCLCGILCLCPQPHDVFYWQA